MDVAIEQSCPSCGASIVLDEDDRLMKCAFCNVHNYMVGSVGRRYFLPSLLSENVMDRQLIYVPYLRFKGSIYYVRDQELKYKIVDTTRLGLENKHFPASLGLRPQAMKIKPVVSSTAGRFILQSIPTKTVFAHASMVIDIFNQQSEHITYHRAFIGETLSRIYQPCYMKGEHLCDAVSDVVIGQGSTFTEHLQKTCSSKVSWEPEFITTICPGCGGLLSGERDSLVLQCTNCQVLWQEQKRKFVPLDWKVVLSREHRASYLPFWQIRFSTRGQVLKTFADFLRFTNQPMVIKREHEGAPLEFWIPAFKVQPKTLLQLASRLTVSQGRIPQGEPRRLSNSYPVTLDEKEALQAIKSVLAYSTISKEKKFPLWPKIQLAESHSQLVYLPFIAQAHDLVQEHTKVAVQIAAIRHGRAL